MAPITIGNFLGIQTGVSRVVAVITYVDGGDKAAGEQQRGLIAKADLLGEIRARDNGSVMFQRGITRYPVIGDGAQLLSGDSLRMVFDTSGAAVIKIGKLQQDGSIEAAVKVDDMLGKHFALLGSTGVGKSSGVAVLLRAILEVRPNLRIFLIDPHNEYGQSFRERAQILTPKNLKLPFWLFNFEETVDVFFRGRPGLEDEVEILSQVIPQAKNLFAAARGADSQSLRKVDSSQTGYTVDTPVPYRLSDLIGLIDERMGKLENRSSTSKFSRLVARIETVRQDPRYAFMFDNANVGGDTMVEVVGQLFRLPAHGKPMTVMQLAGFPSEVVELGGIGAWPHGLRLWAME